MIPASGRPNTFETEPLFAAMIRMGLIGLVIFWCIGALRRMPIP